MRRSASIPSDSNVAWIPVIAKDRAPRASRPSASIAWRTTCCLLVDALKFLSLRFRSRSRLAPENLFLRKQPALYAQHRVKPSRVDEATRLTFVVLARLIDLESRAHHRETRDAIRWHRKGFT